MKIIDFHTHAFPAALAAKTIPMLAEKSGATPFTDGTAEDLSARLRENGIDLGVVLPVVTRPGQFDTVNEFAARLCRVEGLISFGGIHPDDETPKEHIGKICELGLKQIRKKSNTGVLPKKLNLRNMYETIKARQYNAIRD